MKWRLTAAAIPFTSEGSLRRLGTGSVSRGPETGPTQTDEPLRAGIT